MFKIVSNVCQWNREKALYLGIHWIDTLQLIHRTKIIISSNIMVKSIRTNKLPIFPPRLLTHILQKSLFQDKVSHNPLRNINQKAKEKLLIVGLSSSTSLLTKATPRKLHLKKYTCQNKGHLSMINYKDQTEHQEN